MSGALSYLKGEYVDRIHNTWIFPNYPIRLCLRNSGKPLGKRPVRLFSAEGRYTYRIETSTYKHIDLPYIGSILFPSIYSFVNSSLCEYTELLLPIPSVHLHLCFACSSIYLLQPYLLHQSFQPAPTLIPKFTPTAITSNAAKTVGPHRSSNPPCPLILILLARQ